MKFFFIGLFFRFFVWFSPEAVQLIKWEGCISGITVIHGNAELYSYKKKHYESVCNYLYPAFDEKD